MLWWWMYFISVYFLSTDDNGFIYQNPNIHVENRTIYKINTYESLYKWYTIHFQLRNENMRMNPDFCWIEKCIQKKGWDEGEKKKQIYNSFSHKNSIINYYWFFLLWFVIGFNWWYGIIWKKNLLQNRFTWNIHKLNVTSTQLNWTCE